MAPQLTAMNGPAARVDSSWMSRVIRSLPDPLSPVMRTAASTFAKFLLGHLQRLGYAVERDVQTVLEALRLEETQLRCAFVTPLLARAP
jgi:hypothetical protein